VRLLLPRLLAATALPVLLVAGCASADGPTTNAKATGSASSAAAPAALKAVKVTGDVGKKPTVTLASKPTTVTASSSVVVKPGTGPVITKGQRVTVDYLLLNGKDGKEADTSFGKTSANFVADPARLMPGLAKGMIGQKVGSRVLLGVPPAEGFGAQGNPQLGFAATDTLLFVLDLKAARTPLAKATGTPVTPPKGLPTVAYDAKGVPTIKVPKTTPPKKLVVQQLIKGTGPAVKKGQTLSAAYAGVIWGTGKEFDSSYKSGSLLERPIGVGQLVPGFDKGIVGQPVGSRLLLVLPPAEGYGSGGSSQAGIKGTDTLVFVVDVLDAF
jgi:peptidylprolyl isomerase